MTPIEAFLLGLDKLWKPQIEEPSKRIPLQVIGSCALMLQVTYLRGTKDGDVLRTLAMDSAKEHLLALGGPKTRLATQCGIYLDVVSPSVPFLPRPARYHQVDHLNAQMQNFSAKALDITDVVVSKLMPWRPNDRKDVQAMADLGHLDRDTLVERFLAAADASLGTAHSDHLEEMGQRVNQIERDWLYTDETVFHFDDLDDHL